MQQYIALLRGINVSGQKKIKMAELVNHCQDIGLQEVSTYIQSGNICFTSSSIDEQALAIQLQDKITQQYGFDVPVIILNKAPEQQKVSQLLSYVKAPEKMIINEQVSYLHCPNGYGKSKLSNNFVESKLNLVATTRNLKTVEKLISLLNS